MPYIGNQPAESFTSFATQEFSTSATTSYTLDHAVTNENEIALFINNVRQQPGSGKAYTATGTALTLSAATASTDTMYCVFLGRALQTVNPAGGSIGSSQLSADAITGQTALTAEPDDTDEFLVSDAGTIKRVDYSYIKSGSGMVKLQSQTASSASSISFTSTYITNTYKVYELHCIDLLHSSDGGNISLQVSADNGSSYVETGYKAMRHYSNETNGNNTLLSSANTGNSSVSILGSGEGLGTSGNESGNSIITLFNPQGAKSKFFRCNGIQHNTSNQLSMQHFWFSLDQSATYNNIKIIPNTGTFSGTFILYGVTA